MNLAHAHDLVHGSCACAAISFTAALPSLWVAHCHCTQCQRISGAAFMTWAGFAVASCHIQDAKQALHWYASSEQAKRGFCSHCGSALFFSSGRWPNELHITLTNITTPLDKTPEMHVFWETHVNWISLADTLPRKTSQEVFEE